MSHRYTTAFSHLVLAGTGIYCLSHHHHDAFKLSCGTYMIIITNSILGVWYWGNPDYGSKVHRPYNFMTTVQNICAFPLVASQILSNIGFQRELALIPACASMIPLIFYITDKSFQEFNDLLISFDILAVGITTFLHEQFYGLVTAAAYAINHFLLREGAVDFEDVPSLDLYNYGLCFFCYFVLRSA